MLFAQSNPGPGVLQGQVINAEKKPLEEAYVKLTALHDSTFYFITKTDKEGGFIFNNIRLGWYKLQVSYVGYNLLTIDSLKFREEKYGINLSDLQMQSFDASMEEIVVYSEKPMLESKDGNMTLNVGESAQAAGSNASELLNQIPLVSKDADGTVTVKGREPKILIDDKPVELNMQQLQELLESMPGSSIEKIEVLTNPPPQYAHYEGGVINIVLRKGKTGSTTRVTLTGGTRGQYTGNVNYSLRTKALVLNTVGSFNYNYVAGEGYSNRTNIYKDSSNQFNNSYTSTSQSMRPSVRVSADYDFNTQNTVGVVLNYNWGNSSSNRLTQYQNINRFDQLWRASNRSIGSEAASDNVALSLNYAFKKSLTETFRVGADFNISDAYSNRQFYQQFLTTELKPTGADSTQQQINTTKVYTQVFRTSYDKMLNNKSTFLSFGAGYTRQANHLEIAASYKPVNAAGFLPMEALSNDFWFYQQVSNIRATVRQNFSKNFYIVTGIVAEYTDIMFNMLKTVTKSKNNYISWLPHFRATHRWDKGSNVNATYKKTIRRPGIAHLNPTIDFSDPYNVRFGNPLLSASTVHNFDLTYGYNRPVYFFNIGVGYNIVNDVFGQVRSLMEDGRTQVTWENISGRKEYEISTWNGYTFSKKLKVNVSASYVYNRFSEYDRVVRKFRDGGSFTSNVNTSYIHNPLWNITLGTNFNRFANPQGYATWRFATNFGFQYKFFSKRLTTTLNVIDPFTQQTNTVKTFGSNFYLENYNATFTRNIRLTLAYSFLKKPPAKKPVTTLPMAKPATAAGNKTVPAKANTTVKTATNTPKATPKPAGTTTDKKNTPAPVKKTPQQ